MSPSHLTHQLPVTRPCPRFIILQGSGVSAEVLGTAQGTALWARTPCAMRGPRLCSRPRSVAGTQPFPGTPQAAGPNLPWRRATCAGCPRHLRGGARGEPAAIPPPGSASRGTTGAGAARLPRSVRVGATASRRGEEEGMEAAPPQVPPGVCCPGACGDIPEPFSGDNVHSGRPGWLQHPSPCCLCVSPGARTQRRIPGGSLGCLESGPPCTERHG